MPYKDPAVQRAYQLAFIRRRRAEWFEGRSCVACGSTENLEVDHIDPATKESHRVWSWARERREAELAKCQVLCNPCHEIKTADENRSAEIPHGTHSGYSKHRCKCVDCTRAQRDYMREWYAAKKAGA